MVSAAAFAVLLGLGTWQVQRLHWKEGLIAERLAALGAPPVDLEQADLASIANYRPVTATGRFRHEREIFLLGRAYRGESGYDVIAPLILADGRALLVDRGFVPLARRDPKTRPDGQPAGIVTLHGLARHPSLPGAFTPANEAARDIWFTVDIPAMAAALGIADPLPVFVEADAAPNPGGFPIGGQSRTELANDHLGYALTWYGLALALAAIYAILLRGRLREDASR